MITLTKEWLLKTIAELEEERDAVPGVVNVDAAMALAAMKLALASLEAEAVAWLLSGGGAKNNVSFDSGNAYVDPLREVTPLYTAPPAPVSMPDESAMFDAAIDICRKSDAIDEHAWNHGVLAVMSAFSDCRAALLQGADGNSPAIPDGWTGSDEANAALIMLDRIETVDSVDDDRIEGIKRIIRALAAAPKQEVK